ncbi:hem peroxidase [Dillenia turbinata]|uniref:Peroxidase n=1 Tax=Dillenia turbinata TaxID=194707 RepID=A0AAN8W226_9MAGN
MAFTCLDRKALILVTVLCNFIMVSSLEVGFYSKTCPKAESIVRSVVQEAFSTDKNAAAVLLRLHFHDCFVEGCDGSILIDHGRNQEKNAFGHQGVGGFDVIEKAKAHLERVCPATVSCADIVALAARDAVVLSKGPSYEVPTGRKDGLVSNKSLADEMPDVNDSILLLRFKFHKKGLTDKDLVLLSAAHTIGTTACFFMQRRLYKFTPHGGSDPSINPALLPRLKSMCPKGGNSERLPLDVGSKLIFDDHILHNIKNGFGVIESDARLGHDIVTKRIVDAYVGTARLGHNALFNRDFAAAMVKMGHIGVKTGSDGEIRRVCNAFN